MEGAKYIYTLNSNVIVREMAHVNLWWAFDISDGRHYSLNDTAYFILKRLNEGPQDFAGLLELVIDTYDVDPVEARLDLLEILESFIEEGLIFGREIDEVQGKAKI